MGERRSTVTPSPPPSNSYFFDWTLKKVDLELSMEFCSSAVLSSGVLHEGSAVLCRD